MNLADLKYISDQTGSRFAPILTHVLIYNTEVEQLFAALRDAGLDPGASYVEYKGSRIQAGNGRFVVDGPTDLPPMCVDGGKLVAAIAACGEDARVVVDGDSVRVHRAATRARISLAAAEGYPRATPDPETAHTAPGLAALLATLQSYVATDASRPWATSVCVAQGYAYATNNVILVRAPFPAEFPHPVNIPGAVIDAVVAKGEPVGLGFGVDSLTFYFDDGVWIKTQLIAGDWPVSTVDKLIAETEARAWETINTGLASMMATAAKLADDRHPVVEMDGDSIRLVDNTFHAGDLAPLPATGKVNAKMAALALEHATHVQWHTKADVHAFRFGDAVGIFGGQR